jgi:hypothetical protein
MSSETRRRNALRTRGYNRCLPVTRDCHAGEHGDMIRAHAHRRSLPRWRIRITRAPYDPDRQVVHAPREIRPADRMSTRCGSSCW